MKQCTRRSYWEIVTHQGCLGLKYRDTPKINTWKYIANITLNLFRKYSSKTFIKFETHCIAKTFTLLV